MDQIKINIQATPSELMHWAKMLDREDIQRIEIRWYYTQLIIEKPSGKIPEDTPETRPHIHRVFEGATHCIDCGVDLAKWRTNDIS